MKMRERVPVAVTWLLMNNVDGLPATIERQDLGACETALYLRMR
jgi:hypothetical protein